MRDVYVAGAGMTRFAKQPERSLKDLTAEAVAAALKDAGTTVQAVQACYYGNAVAGSMTGQEMLAGQFTLRPLGFGRIPVFNAENACASASTAFHLAWQAVAAGLHDVVLAVAAEKMTHPDKARSFSAIGGSVDVETTPADLPAGRSFLMDMYAQSALRYMTDTGATREDLAAVVVKNQHNGALNPAAQYGGELTIDEVLGSREIVWPFTLQMCSPISDGAGRGSAGQQRSPATGSGSGSPRLDGAFRPGRRLSQRHRPCFRRRVRNGRARPRRPGLRRGARRRRIGGTGDH